MSGVEGKAAPSQKPSADRPIKALAVYCAAADGGRLAYCDAAFELGKLAGTAGIKIVYGGGGTGLMGAVANGALSVGGAVTGVITRPLVDRELAHRGVVDMRIVESMHERKALMASLADAFVALPGGYGTLDELFECLAWAQLSIHDRPIGLLNTAGFFDDLMNFLNHVQAEKFLRLPLAKAMVVEQTPARLLPELASRSCGRTSQNLG